MDPETKDFEKDKTLSILIAQDGLYFYVSEPGNVITEFYEQEFTSLQSPENLLREIRSFFSTVVEENFITTIAELNVWFALPLFTLVPQAYFNKDKLSDYLKFNTKLLPTDELAYDPLKNITANLVYIPYTNINNYFVEKFGEFTYGHVLSSFIDQCLSKSPSKKETKAYINVFPTHFDLCVVKNNQLLLCNSYNYFSPEDFLYYILFTFEQLRLDTEMIELILSGTIEKDAKIFELLFTYVRHVSFASRNDHKKIASSNLNNKSAHVHQLILNTI